MSTPTAPSSPAVQRTLQNGKHTNPIIELRHVSKRFGKLVVLNDVSLQVDPGMSLVVIGASGTGKSVLLKHIVGLLRPDSGEVWYGGRRIDTLSERRMIGIRLEQGFLFQMGAFVRLDERCRQRGVPPCVGTRARRLRRITSIVAEKLADGGPPRLRAEDAERAFRRATKAHRAGPSHRDGP